MKRREYRPSGAPEPSRVRDLPPVPGLSPDIAAKLLPVEVERRLREGRAREAALERRRAAGEIAAEVEAATLAVAHVALTPKRSKPRPAKPLVIDLPPKPGTTPVFTDEDVRALGRLLNAERAAARARTKF